MRIPEYRQVQTPRAKWYQQTPGQVAIAGGIIAGIPLIFLAFFLFTEAEPPATLKAVQIQLNGYIVETESTVRVYALPEPDRRLVASLSFIETSKQGAQIDVADKETGYGIVSVSPETKWRFVINGVERYQGRLSPTVLRALEFTQESEGANSPY